jgi:ABC-type transport system involved in multi-copper enzyme maturation permease subunit
MRPYLAVILDSFHAALSSRVLWIAFVAIWILLGALALVGYREDLTTEFRRWDFDNGTQLKAMLAQGLADPDQKETALGRVSAALPKDLKLPLQRVAKGEEVRIRTDVLADGLNEVMKSDGWYDADAWKATARLRELRDLDASSDADLSDALKLRRARLRIESALPGVFEARTSRSILVTYAGFDFPAPLPFGKEQFDIVVNQFVLPMLMNWLLGFALIFLGILVTASIVPDMLQPGSLHLLLSKPVSRSMLLLSKFFGGCAFVFLCVCQLVIGLWLIAGLRLDIWNIRLLWCIPVSVFLFSVFYSVSFLAGLRWRTPILAIGVTCMFGAFVLVVGTIGGYFDGFVTMPAAIRSSVLVGDDVIATTRGGGLQRFDQTTQMWQPLSDPEPSRGDLVLPLVKLDDGHVATARVKGGRFNPYGSGSLDLQLLERDADWEPEPSVRLPIATRRLLAVPGKSLIAMNTDGLMAADWDEVLSSEPAGAPVTAEKTGTGNWLTELIRKRGGGTSDFLPILPPGVTIVQPVRLVPSDSADWLVLYSLGRITRLDAPDEPGQTVWTKSARRELEGEAAKSAVVAVSGSKILIARDEEPIQILDASTLETIAEMELGSNQSVYSAIGLGDDSRFMVVWSDATCCPLQVKNGQVTLQSSFRDTEVESVAFSPEDGLLTIVHDIDQIDFVRIEDWSIQRKIRPKLSGWRLVDKYVITPLRTLTPQTGEIGQTVSAIVGGKSSMTFGQDDASDGDNIRFRILRPVLSCAGFVVVMLGISCLYFSRRDF